MKRLFLFLLFFLPLAAAAQNGGMDDFFTRYDGAEGVTTVRLERKMMRMMSRQAAERGDRNLAALLDDIDYIRIVSLDEGDPRRFVADAEAAIARERFELLTSNSEEGQTTRFYLWESAVGDKSELWMISTGEKETVVVNIYGAFDLRQVARLSSIRPK